MNSTNFKTQDGRTVTIGAKIASGAEGSIMEINGQPQIFAKIYSKPTNSDLDAKLRIMTRMHANDLRSISAWPKEILADAHGQTMGFLMPKINDATDVHNLYSPKSRKTHFPSADWRFLIHASLNIAKAFATAHAYKCVIGDVNHGSILISRQATASLVDCDSFQIAEGNRIYRCVVGVDTYTPPELQGKSFAAIDRAPSHDAFGLAVMIFHLLFMGRHPFSGKYSGTGDMPIDRAIKEGRFAYGTSASALKMAPPPNTQPLSIVGPQIASMFECAFTPGAVRPSAGEWVTALSSLANELIRCPTGHAHRRGNTCPWCALNKATGAQVFSTTAHKTTTTALNFDLVEFWRFVEAVKPPEVPRFSGLPVKTPSSEATEVANFRPSGGIFPFIAVKILRTDNKEYSKRQHIAAMRAAIVKNHNDTLTAWTNSHKALNQQLYLYGFAQSLRLLQELRQSYTSIDGTRTQRIQKQRNNAREIALKAHLDRFLIEHATIAGIGPGRKATLSSYNIESAADITRSALQIVPGIGTVYGNTLLDWKANCENKFRYDANQNLPQAVLDQIDMEITATKKAIITKLKNALDELQKTKTAIGVESQQKLRNAVAAAESYAQAKADFDEIGKSSR